MTAVDPYRTLEIAPGASQAEIKRAYRRLAKLYHPDSAGDRALPRFLAIQVAYEMLVDEPGRPRSAARGPVARPTPAPSPAWQADASRARATREAYRARTRRGAAAAGTAGAPGPSSRPSTGPSTGSGAGSKRASDPEGGQRTEGPAEPGTTDGPTGAAGASPGATGAGASGRSKRSSRRTKATIGSTSYDGADREPFDPAWEGATWYGAGSGTYWTINPKEYADPRKHGPEYLARSRRGTTASTDAPPTAGSAEAGPASRPDPSADPQPASARSGAEAPPGPSTEPSVPEPPIARPPVGPPVRRQGPVGQPGPVAAIGSAAWPGSSELQRAASTLPGRVIVALLGWIPFAVALAALTEAVPVCGVSTVCADPLTGGIWIVDLALIGLLVAIPRLGWIAAFGSAAFFIVGIAATPVLLALGGSRTPTGTASVLAIVLAAAWLGGVVLALSGRVDLPPWRRRRVR